VNYFFVKIAPVKMDAFLFYSFKTSEFSILRTCLLAKESLPSIMIRYLES